MGLTGFDDWHVKIFEGTEAEADVGRLQAFRLKGATEGQEEAIRSMAAQAGFKDLRGFWKWMQAADITYYDIIKVASPEGR